MLHTSPVPGMASTPVYSATLSLCGDGPAVDPVVLVSPNCARNSRVSTCDVVPCTAKALKAHGAQHLVLIDSISPRRAPTAGRADEAEQMDRALSDPEVLDAARDVAARAGVPLETWIASVVPQQQSAAPGNRQAMPMIATDRDGSVRRLT